MSTSARNKPLVGLLYSSAAPLVIEAAGALIESLDVIPERFFYDLGPRTHPGSGPRFHMVDGALAGLRRHAAGRHTTGHGTGLSLPSDRPLDEALLDVIGDLAAQLGFSWYSEHLSSFATAGGAVPNAEAGLGLPVPYDEDVLQMLALKVDHIQRQLGLRVLLENPAVFTPVPACDYREPEFLNELARRTGCGVLLDLHNLHANERNHHDDCDDYLDQLDLSNVVEVHVAGGTELFGAYTDSHALPVPQRVWDLAVEYLPRMASLQSIVVEFDESSVERMGVSSIVGDLERMHQIVDGVPTEAAA